MVQWSINNHQFSNEIDRFFLLHLQHLIQAPKMASSKTIVLLLCVVAACIVGLSLANPVPQFGDFDFLGVCIRNCAQCKKMFGPYFEGELCAESCVKFKGKVIPDCQDATSIESFLTKYE